MLRKSVNSMLKKIMKVKDGPGTYAQSFSMPDFEE